MTESTDEGVNPSAAQKQAMGVLAAWAKMGWAAISHMPVMEKECVTLMELSHIGESVTQTQRWKIRNFWNFIFCHLNIVRV